MSPIGNAADRMWVVPVAAGERVRLLVLSDYTNYKSEFPLV
ncbi:MAG: hypothetical protein WBW84_07460 [Acidobacteriaceae bacterium]